MKLGLESLVPAQEAKKFLGDPILFAKYHWPEMRFYAKQVEMLRSVRDNVETFVHAGHKLGKDRASAVAVLWFFMSRKPARVIICGSSTESIRDTLWGEIENLIREAERNGRPFNVKVNHLRLEKRIFGKPNETEPLDYVEAKVVKKGEALHGHHLDDSSGPRLMFVFSEATAIDDEHYDAAQTQMHRLLVCANPMKTDGFFYRVCRAGNVMHPLKDGTKLINVIHIDGERDSPNVVFGKRWVAAGRKGEPPRVIPGVLSYTDYLIRQTWPEAMRRVRLHGLFLDESKDKLFSSDMLDAMQTIGAKLLEYRARCKAKACQCQSLIPASADMAPLWQPKHGRLSMGVDVGQGQAATVWTAVGRYGVLHKVSKQTPNTASISGWTIKLAKRWRIAPENIAIDIGGGGKMIVDQLHEAGYEVLGVGFGEKPNDPSEYNSLRVEMYAEAAKLMMGSHVQAMLELPVERWLPHWSCMGLLPGDSMLRQDLHVLPREFDGEGKLRLPPKSRRAGRHGSAEKTIEDMLGRSPDDGDSFVLAVYAHRILREQDKESTGSFIL